MEKMMLDFVKICHHKQFLCMYDNIEDLIEGALDTKLLLINSIKSQRLDKQAQEVKNVEEQPAERRNHAEKVGKDFSRRDTPLFPTMLVQAQAAMGEGSTMPSGPQHTPIIQSTTSRPQKKQKPKKTRRQDPEETQPSAPTDEALNEENVPT
nr:hypothetical protein [Tanacetum cinerariifolium]